MIGSIWLVHPEAAMCEAFEERFAGLPGVRVIRGRFPELPPHDCFVTAGNAFGHMTAGVDAAVVAHFGRAIMARVQHTIRDRYLGEQPIGTAFVLATDDEAIPFLAHAPRMRVPSSIAGSDTVYAATWAALLAVHAHNVSGQPPIETVAFPAMGTGFGGVAFREAARQMAVAYRHYLRPPQQMDWDFVAERELAISYDGDRRVVR